MVSGKLNSIFLSYLYPQSSDKTIREEVEREQDPGGMNVTSIKWENLLWTHGDRSWCTGFHLVLWAYIIAVSLVFVWIYWVGLWFLLSLGTFTFVGLTCAVSMRYFNIMISYLAMHCYSITMAERKSVSMEGGGEELWRVEWGEILIRIYYINE